MMPATIAMIATSSMIICPISARRDRVRAGASSTAVA